MDPFLWNYVLEKGLEEDSSIDESDSESVRSLERTSPSSQPPLTVSAAAIITPVRASSLHNDNDMSMRYPNLSRALGDNDGYFDPTNPSVDKSIRGLLKEINHLLSTKYELNLKGISNQQISYVRVPRTTSDHAFTNSKEWLDTAIKISGSKQGGTFESAYRISNHLIKYYKDSFLAACETQRVPVIKPMTATGFQAMLCAGNLSGDAERVLKKHLSSHLGPGFCPTRRSVNMLSEGHSVVHYGSCAFTFEENKKAEFVEWTEKNVDEEITLNLQRHLSSQSVQPSEVARVQVVVGGDHGDTAFQFGASISVELNDDRIIDFEVSVCELICRKDTGKLIERTILPRLTDGLRIVATMPLHIYTDEEGVIKCRFSSTAPVGNRSTLPKVEVYLTGDLAFQFMAVGKESMSGWWCMQCKGSRHQFLDDCELWTMEELVIRGVEAVSKPGDPQLGVKQQPWWPFIPISNYMTPLLHCEIGIGNQLLEKLRDIINEYIESYAPGEESIRSSVPVLKKIILDTAKQRDEWDESVDGKNRKALMRTVAIYCKHREVMVASGEMLNNEEESTHKTNESTLKELKLFRNQMVHKLDKARKTLADQQLKLKAMRTNKVKGQLSIETKVFKVLKDIGVELSSYHGGSLNGKDIKKVMNNASHVFDKLSLVFKEGKRDDCVLLDAEIESLCLHFREVFVLWDGAFSLARIVNPMELDVITYQRYVLAAVAGSKDLQCTVTPKVHMMLKHVTWQMTNIKGGLGDKMEDWVERLHQTGMRMRRRFRTVANPLVRAIAREKTNSRNAHPDVIAHLDVTNKRSKRKFVSEKKVDVIGTRRKRQRDMGRFEAMQYFERNKNKKLTWSALLFSDDKGLMGGGKAESTTMCVIVKTNF
jgi:hypothetical protein